MTPELDTDLTELEIVPQPSLTYKLDLESGRIRGLIDGQEAIFQAVMMILNTERYAFVIFSSQYGVELERLIGQDYDFVVSDLESTITDALLADDRITGISNFEIKEVDKDALTVSFTVNSIEGDISIDTEVQIN